MVCWPITNNEHCLCLCYRLFPALVEFPKVHSILIIITTSAIQQCARVCWPITNNGTILASRLPLPTFQYCLFFSVLSHTMTKAKAKNKRLTMTTTAHSLIQHPTFAFSSQSSVTPGTNLSIILFPYSCG